MLTPWPSSPTPRTCCLTCLALPCRRWPPSGPRASATPTFRTGATGGGEGFFQDGWVRRRHCHFQTRHPNPELGGPPAWAPEMVSIAAATRVHSHDRYHRVEVLGALASILTVWLVTGILLVEAIQRIITPEPVNGKSKCWRGCGKSRGLLRRLACLGSDMPTPPPCFPPPSSPACSHVHLGGHGRACEHPSAPGSGGARPRSRPRS